MLSGIYFLLYTFLMVGSVLLPQYFLWFFSASVILISFSYILNVNVAMPFVFSDMAFWILGPRIFFFPLTVIWVLAICLPQKELLFWLGYALTILFGYFVPLFAFLQTRISVWKQVKRMGDIKPTDLFLKGTHVPLDIPVQSAGRQITVGILGAPAAERFCFSGESVLVQRICPLSARTLELIYKGEAGSWGNFLKTLLIRKEITLPIPQASTNDSRYLIVHSNAHIYQDGKKINAGEQVNGYTVISAKTLRQLIGE